jgi:hypothetical protein
MASGGEPKDPEELLLFDPQHDRELAQRSVDSTLAHGNEQSKAFTRELPFACAVLRSKR